MAGRSRTCRKCEPHRTFDTAEQFDRHDRRAHGRKKRTARKARTAGVVPALRAERERLVVSIDETKQKIEAIDAVLQLDLGI